MFQGKNINILVIIIILKEIHPSACSTLVNLLEFWGFDDGFPQSNDVNARKIFNKTETSRWSQSTVSRLSCCNRFSTMPVVIYIYIYI